MSRAVQTLTVASVLGSGLVAGVFFAFSSFVMPALGDLPDPQGVAAMQAINRFAPTPWFMTALFGTFVCTSVLGVLGLVRRGSPGAGWLVAGGLLYLLGILLTGGYHVPRNDHLATLDANASSTAVYWRGYLRSWTAWNTVRATASLASTGAFLAALRS